MNNLDASASQIGRQEADLAAERIQRDSKFFVVAAVLGNTVAHLGPTVLPFLIGALTTAYGLTATEAALFGSIQTVAYAVSLLGLARFINRGAARVLGVAGMLLVAGGHTLCYFSGAMLPIYSSAVMIGAGYAVVYGATIAAANSSAAPTRLYSIAVGSSFLLLASVMLLLPQTIEYFGVLGPFIGVALAALLVTPAILGLGTGRRLVSKEREPGAAITTKSVVFVVLWSTMTFSAAGVWAFSERIGVSIGMTSQAVATVLATGAIVAISGSILSGVMSGARFTLPNLAAGLVTVGVSSLMIAHATAVPVFTAGIYIYWAALALIFPYLLGLGAAIDPSGRLSTFAAGMSYITTSAGYAVAGLMVDNLGYASTGWLGLAGSWGAAALILLIRDAVPPGARKDRHTIRAR